ncbi:hypothetical protein SteCoe_1583 [Stentor coeruleus]|uniref:Uncharacterized protein n=1 Tax=Stentor coeruleus TaxID=5963 RepID=A0A1R2D1A8_9CILI|nr:hypothetical protein SteCoe_1583 [Stentor coeruleus]
MDTDHPFYQKLQNSKNILLVKDDVGRAKKCIRDLPTEGFSYGSKLKKDPEGAGSVISSWQVHKPTNEQQAEKDFKKLNKMSLNSKLTTSKQVTEFVKQNDVRVKDRRHKGDTVKGRSQSGDYFGVPNKPSTPIEQVVGNGYGNVAAEEKKKSYESTLQSKPLKPKNSPRANEKIETLEEKKEFKMKKFQQVESKVKNNLISK